MKRSFIYQYLIAAFLLSIFILFLVYPFPKADAVSIACWPFYAKVVSIENNRTCLEVKTLGCNANLDILNHCSEKFYLYEDGEQNIAGILGNYELLRESKILPHNTLSLWSPKSPYFSPGCGEDNEYPNSDICFPNDNPKGYEHTRNGTAVKSWTLKLVSVSNGAITTIKGVTYYAKYTDYFEIIFKIAPIILLLLQLTFVLTLIKYFIRRFIIKKKGSWFWVIIAGASLFVYWFMYKLISSFT